MRYPDHLREAMPQAAMAAVLVLVAVVWADPPTKPTDPTMDFLLNATTKPTPHAATPTTQPAASPLVDKDVSDDGRPAMITLSNGATVRGNASTTTDRPVRIWIEAIKDYRDVPFDLIQSAEAKVVWERDEAEWDFKESGSDVKVYSGKTYPARETQYTLTLASGEKVTGDVAAPIYLETGDKTKTYVLHKRDKGDVGQKLADLLYVKRIDFNPPAESAGKKEPATKPAGSVDHRK